MCLFLAGDLCHTSLNVPLEELGQAITKIELCSGMIYVFTLILFIKFRSSARFRLKPIVSRNLWTLAKMTWHSPRSHKQTAKTKQFLV